MSALAGVWGKEDREIDTGVMSDVRVWKGPSSSSISGSGRTGSNSEGMINEENNSEVGWGGLKWGPVGPTAFG